MWVGVGGVRHDDKPEAAVGVDAHDVVEAAAGAEVFDVGGCARPVLRLPEPALADIDALAGRVDPAHAAGRVVPEDPCSVGGAVVEVGGREASGVDDVADQPAIAGPFDVERVQSLITPIRGPTIPRGSAAFSSGVMARGAFTYPVAAD